MNYKAYCEQRIEDIKKIAPIVDNAQHLKIAEVGIQASLKAHALMAKIKEKMETFFGHALENGEVDLWILGCTQEPKLVKEMDIEEEYAALKNISNSALSELISDL